MSDASGILDVRFESHETILAGLLEHFVQHLQQFGVGLRPEGVRLDQTEQLCEDGLDDGGRVGRHQGAQSGAADDDELRGLHEHGQLAVVHDVATQHGAEDDDQSENDDHAGVPERGKY
jgi:hypothetical protein